MVWFGRLPAVQITFSVEIVSPPLSLTQFSVISSAIALVLTSMRSLTRRVRAALRSAGSSSCRMFGSPSRRKILTRCGSMFG
jgi:hypothetical protein